MKTLLYSLLFWQFKLVDLPFYKIYNLKSAKEFSLKLAVLFNFNIFAIQQNFITRIIAVWVQIHIMWFCLHLLSVTKVFLVYSYKLTKLKWQFVSYVESKTRFDIFFIRYLRMIGSSQLKRCTTATHFLRVIINKFSN